MEIVINNFFLYKFERNQTNLVNLKSRKDYNKVSKDYTKMMEDKKSFIEENLVTDNALFFVITLKTKNIILIK